MAWMRTFVHNKTLTHSKPYLHAYPEITDVDLVMEYFRVCAGRMAMILLTGTRNLISVLALGNLG